MSDELPATAFDSVYASPVASFSVCPTRSGSTSSSSRLGTLTLSTRDDASETVQSISTPALVSHAPRGAITHLTSDNFRRLGRSTSTSPAVHLSLEHFLDFQPPPFSRAPFPLDRYLGISQSQSHRTHASDQQTGSRTFPTQERLETEERVLISMSLRETKRRDQHNGVNGKLPTNGEREAVALGGRGVVRVSPRNYLNWTLPRPPDLLFALVDEPVEMSPSKKRSEKSLKRSLAWLQEQVALRAQDRTNLFATLVGSDDVARRTEFSRALVGTASSRATAAASSLASPLDSNLSGYVLSCAESPASTLLNASLAPLPLDKARIGTSPRGPHEVLRLISEVGIDLFVEEWSQECSTYGIALDFNFPVPASPSSSSVDKEEIGVNLYPTEHAYSFTPLSMSNLSSGGGGGGQLDNAFGPSPPTKSYVHHLLLAHELTSHVILALHNQSLMRKFFESIRNVLRTEGRDGFKRQVERFRERYQDREEGEYSVVKEGKKSWEQVEKARGKGSLREKVLEAEGAVGGEEQEKVLVGSVVEEGISRSDSEVKAEH